MKIKFCGAAGTVTGSSHLLTLDNGKKILLDCGLYQGSDKEFDDFNETWAFDPKEIDVVILSHAHIDHCGRIPKLVKDGFEGDVICTYATLNLAHIMLLDSAFIQEKDAEYANKRLEKRRKEKETKRQRHHKHDKHHDYDKHHEHHYEDEYDDHEKHEKIIKPLYTVKDAEKCMQNFVGISYDRWYNVDKNVWLLFRDAGHILGSASVSLKIRKSDGEFLYFGFTGDIGRPMRPILKDPVPMPQMDYLICESTYGDKIHGSLKADENELLEIIKETCIENRGKLIIPAFSVGRTQEIVYLLNLLENEGKLPKIPIFVDSPLAVNATNVFIMHPECYDENILNLMLDDPDPFGFNGLKYIRKVEESKALNFLKGPAVIISASGMMQAGRIKHHLANNIENPNNTILIVGFNAQGTLGRRLKDGAKEVQIFGEPHKVKAKIRTMDSFSAHGDQKEMLDFLNNQDRNQLKKIFLVHGEEERQLVFKSKLEENGFRNIIIPALEEEFDLPEY